MRAMMVEVVGSALADHDRQHGGRIDTLGRELEARIDRLDRHLDILSGEIDAVEISIRSELEGIRTRIVQLARKQFKEMKSEEDLRVRVGVLEKRLLDLERS